jgi:hypothetical protein
MEAPMIVRRWRTRSWVAVATLSLAMLAAALLVVHYAHWDLVAKYPVDGTVNTCASEGWICQTMALDMTEDKTGRVYHMTLPSDGGEVAEMARATGPGTHVRVYYERRAIWLPWEGSTRRAVGVDWLPAGELPKALGDGGTDAAKLDDKARNVISPR